MNFPSLGAEYEAFCSEARQRNVIFYYVGYFSQNIIAAMSDAVRLQLTVSGADGTTRRRLFSSFVEMAQNIIHYSSDRLTPPQQASQLRHGSVCITRTDNHYRLICANPIASESVEKMRATLEPLRSMTVAQIKEAYKETLRGEALPDSMGAGLGFLTVARDARAPLEFSFEPVDADPVITMFRLVAEI
jgi:hypothetical protein